VLEVRYGSVCNESVCDNDDDDGCDLGEEDVG
jgi:hypothetical protein